MKKLLVNAPTGEQLEIEVGEGGGYFDDSRVLWDERKDGPLPQVTINGMEKVGDQLVFNQAKLDAYVPPKPPKPSKTREQLAVDALLAKGVITEADLKEK